MEGQNLMQPDDTPERDLAALEFHAADDLRGDRPEPAYFTLENVIVVIVGYVLAFGLAALVLGW